MRVESEKLDVAMPARVNENTRLADTRVEPTSPPVRELDSDRVYRVAESAKRVDGTLFPGGARELLELIHVGQSSRG